MEYNLCKNLYIFNDSGTCILHKEPIIPNVENAYKGILQALYYTSKDNNFSLKTISTEDATISFKKFDHKENSILICIISPNDYGDENLAEEVIENFLTIVYYSLVMHIGLFDLFNNNSPIEQEKCKKFFEIYSFTLDYIIENFNLVPIMFQCEKRIDIGKEISFTIKNYMDKLKSKLSLEFVGMYFNDGLIWNSNEWLLLNSIDRVLISILCNFYFEQDIAEIPIYIASTETKFKTEGVFPYKLIVINVTYGVKLVCICDLNYSSNILVEGISNCFDEFLLLKLNSIKIQYSLNEEILNNYCSSILIINAHNKSYKNLLDTTKINLISEIIRNNSLCLNSLKIIHQYKNGNISTVNDELYSEEFYIKSWDYFFYYLQLENLFIYVLLPSTSNEEKICKVKDVLEKLKKQVDESKN